MGCSTAVAPGAELAGSVRMFPCRSSLSELFSILLMTLGDAVVVRSRYNCHVVVSLNRGTPTKTPNIL